MQKSLHAGRKLRFAVTVLNLQYTTRSCCPLEAEYSRKTGAADDGMQRTNLALIPNVGKKDVRQNKALVPSSMVEASRCGLALKEDQI
jgi:hypothetical protein